MVDKTTEINETTRDEQIAFERSERFRFQEQCFLNYHKAHIYAGLKDASINRRPLLHGGRSPLSEARSALGADDRRHEVYEYNHISTLHSKKPAELISMFNQKNGADIFFRLDSSILSQLKPIVELYKIYPSKTTIVPGTDDQPPSRAAESPRYRVAMPIGENITVDQEGMPSRQNLSSLEDLLYDKRVLGNAMLTDLNFKFAGQNIALLNTVEDISFTMSFSSFNMFSHIFETTVGPANDKKAWSYQDLISYSTRHLPSNNSAVSPIDQPRQISCFETAERYVGNQEDPTAGAYNSNYFEIQMIVRYDPDDINWDMVGLAGINSGDHQRLTLNLEEQKRLKSFLRNSSIALRLQFVGHTIRYGSNSSGADPELVIDFEYKAFVETALNAPELDLLKLPASDTAAIDLWEKRLGQARELLFAVVEEKKNLGDIFGAKGGVRTNLNNSYSQLRGALDAAFADNTANNTLQWLIFSPVEKSRGVAFGDQSASDHFGLVPTEKQTDISENGKMRGGRRRPATRVARSVHSGLKLDVDNLETALASTENAKAVFEELVNHLIRYIRMLRRMKIQEKYKSFFKALYAQERVYAVEVATEVLEKQLGFEKDGGEIKETSATEVAKSRAGTSFSAITATDVHVVPSDIKWDDDTSNSQPNQDDMNKNLEALSAKFQNIENNTIDNAVSERTRTTAQEIQKALGSDEMGGMTAIPGNQSLVFFTNLGDIIDTAIAIATYPEHGLFQRRLGILLGPMLEEDMSNTLAGKKYLFNLAFIPVSLKTVMAFFLNNVIASGRERYLLGDFIEEIIEKLILPALGSRCIESAQEGNQQVGTVTFTSEMHKGHSSYAWSGATPDIPPFYPEPINSNSAYPPNGSSAYIIQSNKAFGPIEGVSTGGQITRKEIPWARTMSFLTEVSPNTPIEKQFNYMFIYINNISPTRLNPSNETKNINNGIYYLHLGQIPSIVKTSSFIKENVPYLREARAMGQLTRTGGVSLRDVYHFNCTMYGNNIFKPGMLFYVDPTKDGSSNFDDWRKLGLVGFFRVISVDHNVLAGNNVLHETSVSAKWETFGSCEDGDDGLINTEYLDIYNYLNPITGMIR